MGKQWGHGHHAGQVSAFKQAAQAVKHLQDRDVYAMALMLKLMMTHPDKELTEEAHQALRKSGALSKIHTQALWHGLGAGIFVEEPPPMPKKVARETLFSIAREHGWNG